MKKMLLLLAMTLGLCIGVRAQSPDRLDVPAFKTEVDKGKAQLIDVRTPEEFAKGHLANARNIDWLDDRFLAEAGKLDRTAPVLLYCAVGGRSEEALLALQKAGFKNVHDLKGGINAWKAQGMPVTKQ
ncbi:MAG TPA: rhodanese-like domain-containing protein [Flavobacteriales bacterium]|jgi:rhodanese-related sulfurtransferase|nr:rhodanese-like domain-containing protein [Flavobacteriales bacterium]